MDWMWYEKRERNQEDSDSIVHCLEFYHGTPAGRERDKTQCLLQTECLWMTFYKCYEAQFLQLC